MIHDSSFFHFVVKNNRPTACVTGWWANIDSAWDVRTPFGQPPAPILGVRPRVRCIIPVIVQDALLGVFVVQDSINFHT